MIAAPDFHIDFAHAGTRYQADIWHYTQLTIKERLDHRIMENTYLVYLTGPYVFHPFELFIGEDLEWHTPSSFVVDDAIVQLLGQHIDRHSM